MQISVPLRRAAALAAAMTLIVGVLSVAPAALAVAPTPTTTGIGAPALNPKPVGATTQFTASVSPDPGSGTVSFYDTTGGAKVLMGSGALSSGSATWTVPAGFAAGTYLVMAAFGGNDTYAPSDSPTAVTFTVGPRSTATNVVSVSSPSVPSGATAEKGDTITIQAAVEDTDAATPNPVAIQGTVKIRLDGIQVGQIVLPATSISLPTTGSVWTVGPHSITAVYDPGAATDHTASTSSAWPIAIVANTVKATAGVQYSTFYPYRDGYRDTEAIKGSRLERASVKIRITSPTGTLVRQVLIASGTGGWSYAWNGRTSSGTILAAGRYTVRQTVTDAKGLSKTFTSSVTISTKRLYTYTVALRKNATTQVTRKAADNTWFAWGFTLPSATVYKKLVFAVYGRTGTTPYGTFGPQDFTVCATTVWNPVCYRPWSTFPTTTSWRARSGSVTNNRKGTYVRMYAVGGYRTAVGYARVTVTYALLK